MTALRRRLPALLTALLALLFLAACVLWARSFAHEDSVGFEAAGAAGGFSNRSTYVPGSTGGGVMAMWFRHATAERPGVAASGRPPGGVTWSSRPWSRGYPLASPADRVNPIAVRRYWRRGDFIFIRDRLRSDLGYRYDLCAVAVPYWAVTFAAALFPGAVAVKTLSRRSRRVNGGCAVCGYDLRATPDRCPECGTIARAAGTP